MHSQPIRLTLNVLMLALPLTAPRVLALELLRRGDQQANEQRALERRHEPGWAHGEAVGKQQLQADRGEQRRLRGPERLDCWRRRVRATAWAWRLNGHCRRA